MLGVLVTVGLLFSSMAWGQKLLWQTNLQSLVVATPTAYNGNIYVATYGKDIFGFSPEGNLLFRTRGNAPFTSSPLVLSNFLYITSLDGILYALDAETGAILWKMTMTNSFSSPLASANNLLFIGSLSNTLHAFTASTGILRWKASLKGSVYGRPLVDEQNLYVGDFGGYVSQFDQNGKLGWQTNLGGKILPSPVKWNDVIIIGSSTGNLYALHTNGNVVWRISNTKPIVASPVIYDNSVIVGGYDGYLSRFEASTGKLLWQTKLSHIIEASPVVGKDKVYVADSSGRLFCIETETGAILWEYPLGSAARSSPILVNGKIVIVTINGMLSVIEVTDASITAGPALNPYLTGQNIVPTETSPEQVVDTKKLPNTNELIPEEIPPQSTESSPVEEHQVVFTNVIYITNKITISNVVEVWQPAKSERRVSPLEKYVVQMGAFQNRANSQALLRKLKRDGWRAFEMRVHLRGKIYYRVRVGYFSSREKAYEAQKQLKKYGVPTMIIQEK